jgi:quercetin dioxygenase-like cupin family protein
VADSKVIVLGPGEVADGAQLLLPTYGIKAKAADTGGVLSIFTVRFLHPTPLHAHTNGDEAMFVASGACEMFIEDAVYRLEQGSFAFIPKDVPHAARPVAGAEPAEAFALQTPAGFEAFAEKIVLGGLSVQQAARGGIESAASKASFEQFGWKLLDLDFWPKYDAQS